METESQPLAYSVTHAAELLGIGRTLAYALVKSGELPTVTLGRRVVVPKARLDAMLAGDPSSYALPEAGEIPTVAFGRRVVVPKARLEAMLAGDPS
jgi:excisionase family DNA binding protein